MLSRLHLQNFTVFEDADFHFSPGLNVLVGTNGTGKSHVLKVGYAVMRTSVLAPRDYEDETDLIQAWTLQLTEGVRRVYFGEHQAKVRVPKTELFIRYGAEPFQAVIGFQLKDEQGDLSDGAKILIRPDIQAGVESLNIMESPSMSLPAFVPPKEVLTLMSDVAPLAERFKINLEATYGDFWKQLQGPALQKLPKEVSKVIALIASQIKGRLEAERGYFYLVKSDGTRLPIQLEAEGMRKLAALATLLSNGSLTPETTLFWDEPEANLNPALLKKLAAVLVELARQGFQIILATHSLFLLKEFHILSRSKKGKSLPIRYFGLNKADEPNAPVTVTAVDDFELLPDIVALDEELTQAEKLEEIFAAEDRPQNPETDADAAHR